MHTHRAHVCVCHPPGETHFCDTLTCSLFFSFAVHIVIHIHIYTYTVCIYVYVVYQVNGAAEMSLTWEIWTCGKPDSFFRKKTEQRKELRQDRFRMGGVKFRPFDRSLFSPFSDTLFALFLFGSGCLCL